MIRSAHDTALAVGGGAGLCPSAAQFAVRWHGKKEGAHGGTMGFPMLEEMEKAHV